MNTENSGDNPNPSLSVGTAAAASANDGAASLISNRPQGTTVFFSSRKYSLWPGRVASIQEVSPKLAEVPAKVVRSLGKGERAILLHPFGDAATEMGDFAWFGESAVLADTESSQGRQLLASHRQSRPFRAALAEVDAFRASPSMPPWQPPTPPPSPPPKKRDRSNPSSRRSTTATPTGTKRAKVTPVADGGASSASKGARSRVAQRLTGVRERVAHRLGLLPPRESDLATAGELPTWAQNVKRQRPSKGSSVAGASGVLSGAALARKLSTMSPEEQEKYKAERDEAMAAAAAARRETSSATAGGKVATKKKASVKKKAATPRAKKARPAPPKPAVPTAPPPDYVRTRPFEHYTAVAIPALRGTLAHAGKSTSDLRKVAADEWRAAPADVRDLYTAKARSENAKRRFAAYIATGREEEVRHKVWLEEWGPRPTNAEEAAPLAGIRRKKRDGDGDSAAATARSASAGASSAGASSSAASAAGSTAPATSAPSSSAAGGDSNPSSLKARRKKLPGAPVGARNSYVLFKTEETRRLKEAQPELSPDDRLRQVSRNWTLLSKEERVQWHAREEEDKLRYATEMQQFEAKLAREAATAGRAADDTAAGGADQPTVVKEDVPPLPRVVDLTAGDAATNAGASPAASAAAQASTSVAMDTTDG